MYHIFFTNSTVDGQLGYFLVLAIVYHAAMNIGVHVYFRAKFFSVYVPKSGIVGLYGSSIVNFLRNFFFLNGICQENMTWQMNCQLFLTLWPNLTSTQWVNYSPANFRLLSIVVVILWL